jgi:hypothetical protein
MSQSQDKHIKDDIIWKDFHDITAPAGGNFDAVRGGAEFRMI